MSRPGSSSNSVPALSPERVSQTPQPQSQASARPTSNGSVEPLREQQKASTSRPTSQQHSKMESQTSARPADDDGVIGRVSHYAMPNISSMLPSYANADQEFIFRTFNVGNYDLLKHLPDSVKEQQVMAMRTARMEATRQFLMPALGQPRIRSNPDNKQDLFSTFEYIPSRYSLADELAAKERVESEAKRMAIGGKEFTPAGTVDMPKHKEYTEGVTFPYLGSAYEGLDDDQLAQHWVDQAGAISQKPWVHAGTDKLGDRPTRQVAWDMMSNVRKWISKDWEDADVSIFENGEDCWVIKVPLDKVDSQEGLAAYMNVFVRCNELVNDYKLTKVVEFWGSAPGDGSIYFVLRPPWVRPDRIAIYYTVLPEEKNWSTTAAFKDLERTRPPKKESDFPPHHEDTSALRYASRLEWGVNFLTGTPAAKVLGTMKESGP